MDRPIPPAYVLEGKELIDYLIEKSASTTNATLLEREDRRNRRMTVSLTILTAVGIGGIIGALKMFVHEEMDGVETKMGDSNNT